MSVAFCPSGRKGLRPPLALRTRTAWETREGSGQHFPRRSPSFAHFLREGSMLFWPSGLGRAAAGRRTGRLGELLGTGQRALLTARALCPPRAPAEDRLLSPRATPSTAGLWTAAATAASPVPSTLKAPACPAQPALLPKAHAHVPAQTRPPSGDPQGAGGRGRSRCCSCSVTSHGPRGRSRDESRAPELGRPGPRGRPTGPPAGEGQTGGAEPVTIHARPLPTGRTVRTRLSAASRYQRRLGPSALDWGGDAGHHRMSPRHRP